MGHSVRLEQVDLRPKQGAIRQCQINESGLKESSNVGYQAAS